MRSNIVCAIVLMIALSCAHGFVSPRLANSNHRVQQGSLPFLRMGLLDSILSGFQNKEEGDFVKLEEMNEEFFGPGPVVLLYNVPDAIDNDEVMDMLSDGAPTATSRGISIGRIVTNGEPSRQMFSLQDEDGDHGTNHQSQSYLLDLSLQDALTSIVDNKSSLFPSTTSEMAPVGIQESSGSPVVIFSGFSSKEMMASYNILGEEVYKETASYGGSGVLLACAMAVPNAMEKPLRQVLSEISGDHADAMQQTNE